MSRLLADSEPSHELAGTALESIVLRWTVDDICNEGLLSEKVRPW